MTVFITALRSDGMLSMSNSQHQSAVYLVLSCVVVYYLVDIAMTFSKMPDTGRRGMSMRALQTQAAPKNVSCFIITLNQSLEAVRLKEGIVCHPFLGQPTDADIFSHVDAQVQKDLIRGVSSRGAHYTNNKSVSIAWNHMRVWEKLVRTDGSQDLLVFEDDALITNNAIDVYRGVQALGILHSNYIIKLVNRGQMKWLGSMELTTLDHFVVRTQPYVVKKCVCSTRQNFFNMGAYVLDRDAALVLLERFMPMRFHVDIYVHYVGYLFSNLHVVEPDVVAFSGRPSTHQSPQDQHSRMWPDFKEQLLNIVSSDCPLF
jgi:GR25 family glycosyltransferase involved in LPS biosynthesis